MLRTALVVEMCKDLDLARFIASLLTSALDKGRVHRSLVAFSTGTLAEYISRLKKIDEGVLAILLPSCIRMVEGIDDPLQKDVIVSWFLPIKSWNPKPSRSLLALSSSRPLAIDAHSPSLHSTVFAPASSVSSQ